MHTETRRYGRRPITRQKKSTRFAFFIAGFGMAAWAPLVPYAKARADLSEGTLGLLLLCLGLGSMISMPIVGALAARYGCKRLITIAALVVCLTLPLLTVVSSLPLLALVLFIFGAGVGSIDCVVNMQAVIVERNAGKTMMSGFHGLFSLGGVLGAVSVSAMLAVGLSPLTATLFVVAVLLVALYLAAPHLLSSGVESFGPPFAVPHGVVLFIGLICFVVFLTEGAMLDWSAVFLIESKHLSSEHSGLGYAAFACTMTLGRLTGDLLIKRFGSSNVVFFGTLSSAFGLAIAILIPGMIAALIGFMLVGIGCANIAPVMFSMAGRQTVMPESAAVPAISTMGYAGILMGPAFIGFIAHATALTFALIVVAVLLVCVAFGSKKLSF